MAKPLVKTPVELHRFPENIRIFYDSCWRSWLILLEIQKNVFFTSYRLRLVFLFCFKWRVYCSSNPSHQWNIDLDIWYKCKNRYFRWKTIKENKLLISKNIVLSSPSLSVWKGDHTIYDDHDVVIFTQKASVKCQFKVNWKTVSREHCVRKHPVFHYL